MADEGAFPVTINRLVSYNVRRARRARGWTQDEVGAALSARTGRTWSKATYSAAERAAGGGRIKEWSANELLALAIVFGQPVTYFFLPPEPGQKEAFEGIRFTTTDPRASEDGRRFHPLHRNQVFDAVAPFERSPLLDARIDAEAKSRDVTWEPARVTYSLPLGDLSAENRDALMQTLREMGIVRSEDGEATNG